jgi:transcriptional regulator
MYTPKHFEVRDLAEMHALMDRWSFATLVTDDAGHLVASHLPFLIDSNRGPQGTLMSHMARANGQWRAFDQAGEALVLFQGPHAYISPSWYTVHPSVPTWNYAVVHAYGVPRIVEDPERVVQILRATVTKHEAIFEQPWPMDLPAAYLENMMRGIVAFEIELTRIEGKHKLSQNRSVIDRQGVIEALEGHDDALEHEVAQMMRETTHGD